MLLDDAPAPVVGHGIADRAEEAAHARRLIGGRRKAQFYGIEFDRVAAPQIAPPVDESADRRAVARFRNAEAPGRHELCLAREDDVDERSEEHTSELQALMRTPYTGF